jgi:hypothetical protein
MSHGSYTPATSLFFFLFVYLFCLMRSRVLKYTYETQSWSVKWAPVLEQTLEPEKKDVATLRIASLSGSLSLPGRCKCCEQALILSLASLKSALRVPLSTRPHLPRNPTCPVPECLSTRPHLPRNPTCPVPECRRCRSGLQSVRKLQHRHQSQLKRGFPNNAVRIGCWEQHARTSVLPVESRCACHVLLLPVF